MKKTNLILFLFLVVLIGGVMAETTMNFLTKGFADTLYCSFLGCNYTGNVYAQDWLLWNGSSCCQGGAAGVSSVTGTSPIVSSGGSTPNIRWLPIDIGLGWRNTTSYPAACTSGQFVNTVGDDLTCSAPNFINNCSVQDGCSLVAYDNELLWENSTGQVKLKSPQDVDIQDKNLNNVSSVSFPNMTIKKVITNSLVNGTTYGFYTDGQTGVNMPHFWLQPGGPGQASGMTRSFMFANEVIALQNTINITSCQAFQDLLGVPRNRQIDCNTSTTGVDVIVGDDFLVGGDIVLRDSNNEFHDISRDLQITDEMNSNITLTGLNGTLNLETGNVTISTLSGENIVVNIDKNETILSSNTDSIIITSGTNSSPILNQIVYVDGSDPILAKRTTLSLKAPKVAAFLQGANFTYASAIGLSTLNNLIGGLFNRFLFDGATYKSGFDFNVTTDMINISTGTINFLLSSIDIINNHSTSDLYVHVHSDGSFDQHLTLNACSNYNDGSSIGNNKFYSAVFGMAVTHDGAGVMYVVTQDRPSNEYIKAIDAEVDIENTVNFFPSDDLVSLVYIPIIRVVIRRSGGVNTIQTLSNGLLFDDLRGTVTKTSSSPPPSGITVHSDLSNLDFPSAGHTGNLDMGDNDITANSFNGSWNGSDVFDTHISSDGSDHSFINQSVTTTANPHFNTIYLENGDFDFLLKGKSTIQDEVSELTFNTNNAAATITVSGTLGHVNQDVTSSSLPTFTKVTTTGDIDVGRDISIDRHAGIGTVAGTDVWEVLNMEFTRANNFGGWYIENLAADGISRFSVGMNHLTGTKGVLFQYDNEDGRAVVLNRKATVGTMELTTTGGGVKVRNDGGVILAAVYNDDIGTERDLLINASGDLGYDSSSIVFKENVKDMTNEMSSKIHQLRPVTYDKISGKKNQIGLIAEEVYELYPEFISYKREEIWGECCLAPDDCYECVTEYRLARDNITGELIPETISYKKLVIPLIQEVQNLKEEKCDDRLTIIENCIANSKDFIELKACI